jgi:BMFP domain-containing protein YqiC
MKKHLPTQPEDQRQLALNRRQFLRGVGVCMALPVFESSMAPVLRAATKATDAAGAPLAVTSTGAPLRTAYVYVPNGVHQQYWWPTGEGTSFELARTMQPLAAVKGSIQVVGGLDHKNAAPGNDGAGDHARANATFLTGARARKTDSVDIHVGASVDQVAAQQIGHLTRFSSLELSCDNVRKSGTCDSGYSCAYQYNLAWRSATTPMTPEPNPRLVFERLFGAGSAGERQKNFEQRQQTQKSLLDLVMDDTRSLQNKMGAKDRDKLDEYLTGVRTIEQRIQRAESFGKLPVPGSEAPNGIPENFGEHMDIMFDLLAMAFQTDSTRIATLLLANDGSNRSFAEIGIPEGHHYCSHHRNNPELVAKIGDIDLHYMKHFARFLEKLDQTKDVDGKSLLHNSMIVYGSGNADGNRHTHDNLPVIVAGAGGGTLTPGRFAKLESQPMSNLFLSLNDRLGVRGTERIGDSNGRLQGAI